MAYHLIGGDAVLQIKFGGPATGGTPTWDPSPTVLTGSMRNITVRETVRTVDVSAASSTRERHRVTKGNTTITIEKFVSSTGSLGYNKVGYYIQVEFKELGSLATYKQYTGIVRDWQVSGGDAEMLERLEVLCDAEYG